MNKLIFSSVLVGVLSVGSLAWAEENISRPAADVFCGGIAGKQCLDGYVCKLEGSFPDAGGTCIKIEIKKDVRTKVETEIKDAKERLKNTTEAVRDNAKKQKEELDSALKTKRIELENAAKVKREELKENIEKRKEEFVNAVKEKRAELEDKIKTKREALKVRLEKVKDERKKETVERIDKQIDALNDKMMRHFSSVLDKLEEMLVRISERADKVSIERGLDVSAVRSAIDKANTAIASARSAIETQSGKTYTITITTEIALKTDVGRARQALGADLAKVKDAVSVAHSAVREAAVALAQLVVKPRISPSVSPIE